MQPVQQVINGIGSVVSLGLDPAAPFLDPVVRSIWFFIFNRGMDPVFFFSSPFFPFACSSPSSSFRQYLLVNLLSSPSSLLCKEPQQIDGYIAATEESRSQNLSSFPWMYLPLLVFIIWCRDCLFA